jgi:molecular chaperone HscB
MTADMFSLLGLPATFDLDSGDLEKRYFTAQRIFHPDRLVGKSPAERTAAINTSMRLNEAYETLKSPLKRARALLVLKGASLESAKPSQALLMASMEQREALAEAHDAGTVEQLAQENETSKEDTLASLQKAFMASDLQGAVELTLRLGYLTKFADEIRISRKKLEIAIDTQS